MYIITDGHTPFLYKNYTTQAWAWIIPNFKSEFEKFETDPTSDYVLEMFLSKYWIVYSRKHSLETFIHFFQKFTQ